ncbi:hypothetical protein PAN31108_01266 [Pandoraea anhela]|uniref:Uncharacterized protein n=2 Tax=Pandoraea anhela TaxID=2508295 RepID=A0A5E4TBX5_9BURK|nr:hypothetical protein PAN31108_01266 [Pandoraea anhela]
MTISLSAFLLTGTSARTMSAATIRKCATAVSEQNIRSRWGLLKDHFLGTDKEDAKRAIFRLATAETTWQQCYAFTQLASYIEPEQAHLLRWNLTSTEILDFQVGDWKFPVKSDVSEFVKHAAPLGFDDSCRLLMTLRVNGYDVLTESDEFGLPLEALLRHPYDPNYLDTCLSAVQTMSPLLAVLQVLGLRGVTRESELPEDVAMTVHHLVGQRQVAPEVALQYLLRTTLLMNITATPGYRN